MGGLASDVKMSKSGLFAHFGSKQELQLATVAQAWATFEAYVLMGPPDRPQVGLRALLERWLSFYERRVFRGGCFFVISAVEFAAQEGEARDALASTVEWQLVALEAAILEARRSGELRVRRDAAQMAFELHSILVNADALFHVSDDSLIFERARAAIDELLAPRYR